nr:unnamed protein product [Callosobruchus chinensis]
MTIRNLIHRFQQQGSVSGLPRTARPRSAFTNSNIHRAEVSVQEDAEASTRRRSTQLGVSRASLRRILRHLRYFPYKIQLVQQLQPQDYAQRLNFARRFQQLAREERDFVNRLIMSDEAHFHLNGFVNTQNCRMWGTKNPRSIHQHPLHPVKCTVWCAVTSQRIIGPYFFETDDGNAVTVTGERYREMIQTFLIQAIRNEPELWFQQDGATPHTAGATMLRQVFGDRLISKRAHIAYPPRSPDLTARDFYLWGYLKEKVYRNKPQNKSSVEEQY